MLASDLNPVEVDSLKALDPDRPIREADMPKMTVLTHFARPRLTFAVLHNLPADMIESAQST